jgi:hypothetical protein
MPLEGVDLMPPKKSSKSQPQPQPQPQPSEERTAIIHLKGTVAYSEWLDRLNRKTHIPKAALVRLAIAEWAARHGHEPPPEF